MCLGQVVADAVTDPIGIRRGTALYNAVAANGVGGTLSALWDSGTQPYTSRWNSGHQAAAIGYGTFEVILAIATTKGLSKLAGAGAAADTVATNTAPKAIEASTRVAPWAGRTVSRLTTEGETMYRVWGGGADQVGGWITPIKPGSSAAARQGLALPSENAAMYVSEVRLPAGVRVQVGEAGPAFGQPGGWPQAQLLERIPASSFGPGEVLP